MHKNMNLVINLEHWVIFSKCFNEKKSLVYLFYFELTPFYTYFSETPQIIIKATAISISKLSIMLTVWMAEIILTLPCLWKQVFCSKFLHYVIERDLIKNALFLWIALYYNR